MTTASFESYLGVIAWLAGACFCGLLPIGFAAILFFTSRRREKVGSAVGTAMKTTIAALQAGSGLSRLEGRISPAANAIDGPAESGLVYLRLRVERYESDSDSSGWRGLTDKSRGVPFQLEDGSGTVWVDPEGSDKQLLGTRSCLAMTRSRQPASCWASTRASCAGGCASPSGSSAAARG